MQREKGKGGVCLRVQGITRYTITTVLLPADRVNVGVVVGGVVAAVGVVVVVVVLVSVWYFRKR